MANSRGNNTPGLRIPDIIFTDSARLTAATRTQCLRRKLGSIHVDVKGVHRQGVIEPLRHVTAGLQVVVGFDGGPVSRNLVVVNTVSF